MDALAVKTILDNITHSSPGRTSEDNAIYKAKVEIAAWVYNNGDLRTETEMESKYQSIQEEILVYEFAEERGYLYQVAQGKLKVLNLILAQNH